MFAKYSASYKQVKYLEFDNEMVRKCEKNNSFLGFTMKNFIVTVLTLSQICITLTKKYIGSGSDESVEKFLYVKDCRHGTAEATTTMQTPEPVVPELLKKPRDTCQCPRMCCNMCCDCNSQLSMTRGMQPMMDYPMSQMSQPMSPFQHLSPPKQPQFQLPTKRKTGKDKTRMGANMQLPILNSRRSMGNAKEQIKSLISQDEDVKRILKDLVRVTMQKVDLIDMINRGKENMRVDRPREGESVEEEYED